MMPDHYATLGVDPTANAKTIRAAYLGLMREYHPDRNPSPEAVARAQSIIAAFKVLSDFDRRNHYDWDQRRAREAAAATAAERPRRVGATAVAAGALGLAAVAALSLMPTPPTEPGPFAPPVAEVRQAPVTKAEPAPRSTPVAVAPPAVKTVERPAPVAPPVARVPVASIEPVRVAKIEPVRVARSEPLRRRPAKIEPAPVALRSAAVSAPAQRVASVSPPPRQARAAAKPVPHASRNTTDLASLDQFVMSFYGQSWRFGDPPRRAALEQTRAGFVARRGACTADPCKRAAYLKLMRDVSDIVASGQPKVR